MKNSKFVLLIIIVLNVFFCFSNINYTWATNFTDKVFFDYHWWRIFSYSFFHLSVLHLLLNMILLFLLTWSRLLDMLKKSDLLMIYIFSSAWAALGSSFNQDDFFQSLGASGAVAGILGMRFVCLFRYRKFIGNVAVNLSYDWIINGLGVLFFIILTQIDEVDNIAHLVGIISGIFITIIIFIKNKFSLKSNNLLLMLLLMLSLVFGLFCYSKNKSNVYGQSNFIFLKNQLEEYNNKAVEYFNKAQNFYSDKKFYEMVNNSIIETKKANLLLKKEIKKENRYSHRQKKIFSAMKKKFEGRLLFFLGELKK